MVAIGKQREEDVSEPILETLIENDRTPWYKKPNLRNLYLVLFPACMGIEITSGFDSQIINTVQIAYPWNKYFGELTGELTDDGLPEYEIISELKGFLAAAYSLGAVLALPFVPWINQKVGRRWTIMFGSCISLVGAILQGLSNGAAMYCIARIVLGFGIPFCIVAGSSMLGELGYPKERPILTSLFNSSYFIGQITAAAVGLGTVTIPNDWAWRVPSLLQIAPAMIQIVTVLFLPESPRYLVSKDRTDEAVEILTKYHAEGDRDSVIVKAEIAQIERTILLEREEAKQSWGDLFRTAGMRRRLFITAFLGLFTQWSGNTLISYYLSDLLDMVDIKDSVVKSKINVGIACWGLVCGTTLALTAPRFKRRTMYLTTACALLSVYIAWTISMERAMTTETKAAAALTILFIFLYSPAYNLGYNALTYTYLIEIFPYFNRSRGLSWFQFYGRGATFFATYVNPIGLDRIQWRWLIVYCCWLAFEVVFIYFFFPETSGRTLEELSFMFEGREKADEVAAAVHKQIDETEHKGVTTEIHEKTTYETDVTGPPTSQIAILAIYDIFGNSLQTTQGADILATRLNALVLIPDFFRGDGAKHEWVPADTDGKTAALMAFVTTKASFAEAAKSLPSLVDTYKSVFPSVQKWGAYGLCWGGKVLALSSGEGTPFAATVQVHPGRIDKADAQTLTIPHAVLASKDEPADEVAAYKRIIGDKGLGGFVETYGEMWHGWMGARANLEKERSLKKYVRGYEQLAESFDRYLS